MPRDIAQTVWDALAEPQHSRLEARRHELDDDTRRLTRNQTQRSQFLADHPDIYQQIAALDHQINAVERQAEHWRSHRHTLNRMPTPWPRNVISTEAEHHIPPLDLTPQLGGPSLDM